MAVIWRFKDGKAGHERQTAGFIQALQRLTACDVYELGTGGANPYWCWLTKSYPVAFPKPDFIIGAGSACQAPMLAAKRSHGGRTICLMRPKFPISCFDLCIIPAHDGPPDRENVIKSEGALNDLSPTTAEKKYHAIILVGGPSKHHGWDSELLVTQIDSLLKHSPEKHIALSTSRRTPVDTTAALAAIVGTDCEIFDDTNTGWLAQNLGLSDTVWVTSDSISMMYETLTVGANLGLLEMPIVRHDRIAKVAPSLLSRGYATSYAQWQETGSVGKSPTLSEANRIAQQLSTRYPQIIN